MKFDVNYIILWNIKNLNVDSILLYFYIKPEIKILLEGNYDQPRRHFFLFKDDYDSILTMTNAIINKTYYNIIFI